MGYNATDREQIESLKQWWHDYGKAITIAVVIGLLIGVGWRYWSRYNANRHNAASQLYMQMFSALGQKQSGVADQYAKQLKSQYTQSPYAALAGMLQAKQAVAKADYHTAVSDLHWVVSNSKVVAFQDIARVREARVLLQEKQAAKARAVLAEVKASAFEPVVSMVKKAIDKAQGVPKKAGA